MIAPMTDEFADCLVLNTVKAARALMRRYDKALKPFDVSVVQFTVLMTVRRGEELSMGQMAKRISMDRTTLLRNIELLIRRGLVEARPAPRGNGRSFRLTAAGEAILERIVPLWRAAQKEIRQTIGDAHSASFLATLKTLSAE